MQKVNKHIFLVLLLVAIVCFVSVKLEPETSKEAVSKQSEVMDVFLSANNKVVIVPTTTSKKEIPHKIEEIISYMKQDVAPFERLLSESTILDEVKVDNETVILSFSQLKYEKEKELQVLEALIYSCTQFTGINQIQIILDEQVLQKMPVNKTPLSDTTRQFGMNHMEPNQLYLHVGNSIPVYYQMKIKDKYYDVIQSVEVKDNKDYNEVMKTILDTKQTTSYLQQPLSKYQLKMTKPCTFKNNELHLYFNTNLLNKDKEVPAKIIRYLKLNLQPHRDIKAICLYVNGKMVTIDGKNKVMIN